MTREEAWGLLRLGEGAIEPEQVRRAYLRRLKQVKPEVDPDGFAQLRAAYELLREDRRHAGLGPRVAMVDPVATPAPAAARPQAGPAAKPDDGPAPDPPRSADPFAPYRQRLEGRPHDEQRATARVAVEALPDCAEARRVLLSLLEGEADGEAFKLLLEGAARQPDEFLDDLLWHFPARLPPDVLQKAASGAGMARRLLVANAHAEQSHADEAKENVRAALALVEDHALPPPLLRLALRPVFALHMRGLVAAADAIHALVKQRAGQDALDALRVDHETAILFGIADDLARVGPALPLGLRQAAARAARTGRFDMTPTDAGMAAQALDVSERTHWQIRLGRVAPTLSDLFRLDAGSEPEGQRSRRGPQWQWVLLPLLLSSVGVLRSFSSSPSIPLAPSSLSSYRSTTATTPDHAASLLIADLQARLSDECGMVKPNVVCRDLPAVLDGIGSSARGCAGVRMRLDLVASASLELPPGHLPDLLREARAALDVRCPP